jgi:hypothetical protein
MASVTLVGLAATAASALLTNKENINDAISDMSANSLLEMGKLTEVEVITSIDSKLTVYESTTDVLKVVNSLYASWYLSAASIVTDTGRIKTVKLLEKLNPAKNPSYAVASTILSAAAPALAKASTSFLDYGIGEESKVKLPNFLPTTYASFESAIEIVEPDVSTEAMTDDERDALKAKLGDHALRMKEKAMEADLNPRQTTGSFKSGTDLTTVANLSLGQSVVLNINDGTANKDITVNIRLITVPVDGGTLSTILSWSQNDLRLKSRLSAWRAGELRFWRDVVMMRDVFTERQKILINEKSDLLKSMLARQKNSMLHSVLTMTPSVGTMSSVLVISSDTLERIEETKLNGSISNFAFRQHIMNTTGLVMIVVVDPSSELVTFYKHTSALPSEASIRQLKSAGKGGANDLSELIKLMNQNKMPSFG